jgi:hypothetical protein
MTLGETLHKSLSDWPAHTDGPHERTATAGGWTATVKAAAVDTVGAKLHELELTRTAPAPEGTTLGGWAEGVAKRASGLLERLKVHEVDATHNQAVLRSDGPTVKADVAGYYEVVLTGTDKATVNRYQADRAAGTKREPVPFALTHETVAKLADDIAG